MSNNFTGHVNKWMELAESETDYAILFVRNWIPFNAWYCNSFPIHKNNDYLIIKDLKNNSNPFKTRIVALLLGSDNESQRFKFFLGALHESLEKQRIINKNSQILFSELYYRENPIQSTQEKKSGFHCKADCKLNNHIEVIIIKNGLTKFSYTDNSYSENNFFNNSDFLRLTGAQKEIAKNCFIRINPKMKESLILSGKGKFIDAGGVKFIDDTNLVAMAIIDVLYRLRCVLFHGEIQPTRDNLGIYENAYHIMRSLIKSIK